MTGAVNLANWTNVASNPIVLRTYSSSNSNHYCPIPLQNCWALCGQSNDGWYAYMYTIASTIGYQQIELTYSIGPNGLGGDPDHCEIYYTLDSKTSTSDWIFINKYATSDGNQVNRVFTFNGTADNNTGLGIFIYAKSWWDLECCHLSDWKLTGIPISNVIQHPQ